MSSEALPSIERVRELFCYDPESGIITWAKRRFGVKFGSEAGTEHKGYKRVKVDSKLILVHRVAWAIHYGKWPVGDLDHINRDRSDNRIVNLREATRSVNMINRDYPKGKSGVTGVSWHKRGWQAAIRINGRSVYLGIFKTVEEAASVRAEAEKKEYGQFAPKGE